MTVYSVECLHNNFNVDILYMLTTENHLDLVKYRK